MSAQHKPLPTMPEIAWWEDPQPPVPWEVRCVDSHGRPTTRSVFIRARTPERAVAAGKYWMRVVGIKRRGTVVAKRYHPERDPAFQYGDWRIVPNAARAAVATGSAK